MTIGPDAATELLSALEEQLRLLGETVELVVIGGSALLALGLVQRTTRDVDVVALRRGADLERADPLPPALAIARDRVANDYALRPDWLNAAPAGLLDFGLPAGFLDRVESRRYGPALVVHFASRFDQIHLKLYAAVDQGPGKHEVDLRALNPEPQELLAAAAWAQGHDPSDGFRQELEQALAFLGVTDVFPGH